MVARVWDMYGASSASQEKSDRVLSDRASSSRSCRSSPRSSDTRLGQAPRSSDTKLGQAERAQRNA